MRKLRRHGCIDRDATNPTLLDSAQHCAEAVDIESFGKHVFHDFAHQRMIGDLYVAFDIFLTRGHIGEYCTQQIVRAHALDLRRNFLASLETEQRQSARCVPSPARLKDRRRQRRLLEDWRHRLGVQELKNIGQRETMLFG